MADGSPVADVRGRGVLVVALYTKLGDVILLAPALQALSDAGARVTVLIRAGGARVLGLLEHPWKLRVLDEDLVVPPGAPARAWRGKLRKARALERSLEAEAFDVAVDLTRRWDVESLRWITATRAGVRLAWIADHETPAALGLTHGVVDNRHLALRHWTREQLRLLGKLGVGSPAPLRWATPEGARADAEGKWGAGPRVLLVPGGAKAACVWPPERFLTVAEGLRMSHDPTFVVVGAPSEAERVDPLAKALGAAVYLGADLGVLLALVRSADLVLSNDTGPMHLAFLAGVPTVAVFLGMPALAWGPLDPGPRSIVLVPPDADDPAGRWTGAALTSARALLAEAVTERLRGATLSDAGGGSSPRR